MSQGSKRKDSFVQLNPQKKVRLEDTMGSRGQLMPKKKNEGVKKLVIKNLKVQPKLPENFEEETWNTLKQAIHAVYNSQISKYSLEELYKATENLCSHKKAANLYEKLHGEIETHIKGQVHKLKGQTADPNDFLNLHEEIWQQHCSHTILIRSIFLYLDRTYVLQHPNVRSIWDMGLDLYREHIATESEIAQKTTDSMLALIRRDREGEAVEPVVVQRAARMLTALRLYKEPWEPSFLVATLRFYTAEGLSGAAGDVAKYTALVERRLSQESERALRWLDPSTRPALLTALDNALLRPHVGSLTQADKVAALVSEHRVADLRRLHALLTRVQALDMLRQSFADHLKAVGCALVADPLKEPTLVDELLQLKVQADEIVQQSFQNQDTFVYAVKESFEHSINSRANKPAELIAKFIDQRLRSGNKGISEDEMETILDRVLILFRFIHGKDVFEAFYKKDLAKRLLLNKSASADLEKSMLSKLKAECGSSFTNKLEGMFKDVELSKDTMSDFRQSEKVQDQMGDIELNVHVLTAGFWPAYNPVELNLPKQLSDLQEVFKSFYLGKYSGRRLTWQNSLGHCVVRAQFSVRKELYVSLFQTVVLLMFNENQQLSFREVQETIGMEPLELKRTLQSLACGKVRVLTKEPKGREVGEGDSFSVNSEFKHKLVRIKINSIQMKETVEEKEKTTQGVMQDRQYQIDAAIVRIMKTRKSLTHTLLVSELFNQLKFPVKASDLKKRIESLIDREYLERDAEDSNVYRYLA